MRAKRTVVIMTVILSMILLTASCAAPNDGTRTVQGFFGALCELDFVQAGSFAGNEDLYSGIIAVLGGETGEGLYERIQSTYFINFIYSNLEWKITSSEKTDDSYSVKVRITAFVTDDILAAVRDGEKMTMESPAYASADADRQYMMLINNIPEVYGRLPDTVQTKTVTVTLKVVCENGTWHIVPTAELFSAIGGM